MRRIQVVTAVVFASVGALANVMAANAQGVARVVRGMVRDSARANPVGGAVVQLRAVRGGDREMRTDDDGTFRFRGVSLGEYRLSVRQVGFAPFVVSLVVPDADTSIAIRLVRNAQNLRTVEVRDDVPAIVGVVGTMEGLRPIVGASIEVAGGKARGVSDSTGHFFVGLEKVGAYVVRIHRDGFVPLTFTVDAPRAVPVDASRLLDSTTRKESRGAPGLWADFDQRLRWRAMNSAMVPGAELTRYGGTLTDALRTAPSFTLRGLRIGPNVCVFIDGVAKPGLPLDAVQVEEIAAIETYGVRGDPTGSLKPERCRFTSRTAVSSGRPRPEEVNVVSIWLRRP